MKVEELRVYIEHYLRRGYRCRLVDGMVECTKRINELMDHIVIIKV